MSAEIPLEPVDVSDQFWDVIQRANKDPDLFRSILDELSDDELYRFALEFMYTSDALQQEPYTDHIYPGKDVSEDAIADMSYWVVSQGKGFYLTVWNQPETLATYGSLGTPETLGFEFAAEGILARRQGEWPGVLDDYADFARSGYNRVSDYWEARHERR